MKSITKILIAVIAVLTTSCGIYNFRGANIPDDVKTFSVGFFSNEASYVNPSLSVDLTEKLKTKFQTETTLNLKSDDGDYQMSGVVKRYEITPAALNAQTGAAQTQFSITINVDFICPKHPEKDFSKDFTSSTTFDASTEFSSVESSLTAELTEIIVQQIFAAIALDW